MRKKKLYRRVTEQDDLLGETVWVGTETQINNSMSAEGLVVKEHPLIVVKLDSGDNIQVNRGVIWLRKV